MPTTVVNDLGSIGLVADKEPTSLPPNAWTEISNTRCVDRSIASFAGYISLATLTGSPQTLELIKNSNGVNYLVYGDTDKLYSVTSLSDIGVATEAEIGSGFSTAGFWDSTVLGGVGVFTNGFDNPQYWGGSGSALDLPYDETGTTTCLWSDVGMTAKIIRSFRYHLFALNIEDCEGKNCRKVHWSHPADPGTVPITWRPELADYDAGFNELTDTPGCIVDALPLRDTLQIYKTDAVYSVTYTGRYSVNEPIWNFRLVTTTKGLYARNCVCDFGGKHFFVADGDIYVYDGVQFESIADERVKNLFFDNVSRSNKDKTFCVYYERTQEVWLCYPEEDQTSCTKALVWDSIQNTWSQRDIPSADTAIFSVVERTSGYTYDSYTSGVDTYDDTPATATNTIPDTYDDLIDGSPFRDSLILGAPQALYEMDRTNQANGVNQVCYARRTHLDLGDKADWHMVLTVYPRAEGDPFDVRVGSTDVAGASPTWSAYQTFTPGTDYKLDFRVTGRMHDIEFYSDGDVSWNVESYEVDYEIVGRR